MPLSMYAGGKLDQPTHVHSYRNSSGIMFNQFNEQ